MQLARRDILNGLERKGFVRRPREGDHIRLVYYDLRGKKTQAKTKMSRGTKHRSIGMVLLGQMARQCRLSRDEFVRLVECSMDRPEYDEKIGKDPTFTG